MVKHNIKSVIIWIMACFFSMSESKMEPDKTTIFIHGTLFTGINYLVHTFDIPLGLTRADKVSPLVHGHIPKKLHHAAPQEFADNNFYYFGWSGLLSFSQRRQAALQLYHIIKQLPQPITLIGHSHGGNIILELGRILEERADTQPIIDRVILLATPIQAATSKYAAVPNFKEVYSCYSEGDWIQILDPQGIYQETQQLNQEVTFFSERLLPNRSNIKQARILSACKNPSHLSFIYPYFMKHLPEILSLMKKNEHNHMVINIPKKGSAYIEKTVKRRKFYLR